MLSRTLASLFLLLSASASAQTTITGPLPPLIPWSGESRNRTVSAGDRWSTPVEQSNFRLTPSYDETVAWLQRLVAAAPELRMVSLGKSGEGRDIWMVIASRDRAFTAEALRRTGKPVLLAQGGIHAGEIDGKDAGMMFLRELTVGGSKRALLERANFLFVPIFNVDGHERTSAFGRINQRGPEIMGWRTNARNLNLNRDYSKADTPEMRAMIGAIDRYKPDLYLDLHVTDGADYQYDVTYGWNSGWSPGIARWLDDTLGPALMRDLRAAGHIPGPLVFPVVGDDVSQGIALGNAPPRLSTGYGDVRHFATVLVENHSLKPYDQRVLGTLVLLESTLETLGRNGAALRRAIAEAEQRRMDPVPLGWRARQNTDPETIELLSIEARRTLSPISGTLRTEWLGKPVTVRVPLVMQTEASVSVKRPKAYWIPAAWSDIAERLRWHGIAVEKINSAREVDVEMDRLQDPKLATEPFEGHVPLTAKTTPERHRERFAAGSYRVSTDQPLGDLAIALLEPQSEDSFLQWGFFHEILQRTEYVEDYVVEPMAAEMLAADPKLAAEFEKKIAEDPAFRASPDERLRWFYQRSRYFDERWLLYPIGRER